jgi:enamine deaminase RidA (YjgF/YER057c/UK114 family)
MSGLAVEPLNPAILPPATGNYTHGVQVDGAQRMVFVSGQVPWGNEHGRVPKCSAGMRRHSPSSSATSMRRTGYSK